MTAWFVLISLAITLCICFVCVPWVWLAQGLLKGSAKLGECSLRFAPPSWQVAWQTVGYLQHRLTAIILLLSLAICLWTTVNATFGGVTSLITLATALIVAFPLVRALRALRRRTERIIAALPAQLDLLAMLLVAGQPLLISLQQSSSSGMDNPLREELRHVVGQVRAGASVDIAFERLSARYPCRELRLFCSALHHARESGAGLAGILYEQAEQRRQELFLRAEKKAMEAPVKLMFPLLIFIFPGTVLVLVVTLAAKMMWNL